VRGCHKCNISAFVVDGRRTWTIVDSHDFRERIQFCLTYNLGSATFLDLTSSNVAGLLFGTPEIFGATLTRHSVACSPTCS
jgi:hypothetical protein